MIQYIPSQEQREYLNKIGFEFDDFQKATLIWNSPDCTLGEKLSSLNELSYSTKNIELKNQITERIEYENLAMELFKKNSENKNVYFISYYFDEYSEYVNEGYFFRFDDALEFCMELIAKEICNYKENINCLSIQKHKIYTGKANIDDDTQLGELSICINGKINHLYSSEYNDKYDGKKGRFENAFFTFPLSPAFQKGTVVQSVDNGYIYLIGCSYDSWNEYCNGIWKKYENELEYWEIAQTVYQLTKCGEWSHEHINPMYLTTDINWNNVDSDYRELIELMGKYLNGDNLLEKDVLSLSRKYAYKHSRNNNVYSAEKMSDIMF